nr:hypothetical protein CFP56_30895 [Quercus suber]
MPTAFATSAAKAGSRQYSMRGHVDQQVIATVPHSELPDLFEAHKCDLLADLDMAETKPCGQILGRSIAIPVGSDKSLYLGSDKTEAFTELEKLLDPLVLRISLHNCPIVLASPDSMLKRSERCPIQWKLGWHRCFCYTCFDDNRNRTHKPYPSNHRTSLVGLIESGICWPAGNERLCWLWRSSKVQRTMNNHYALAPTQTIEAKSYDLDPRKERRVTNSGRLWHTTGA